MATDDGTRSAASLAGLNAATECRIDNRGIGDRGCRARRPRPR